MDASARAKDRLKPALDPTADALPPMRPSLTIDYELYAKYLEGSDWPDEKKREFIETLWSVIVAFVDLGFGVHPLQCNETPCEQNGILDAFAVSAASNLIDSDHQPEPICENTSGSLVGSPQERSQE